MGKIWVLSGKKTGLMNSNFEQTGTVAIDFWVLNQKGEKKIRFKKIPRFALIPCKNS